MESHSLPSRDGAEIAWFWGTLGSEREGAEAAAALITGLSPGTSSVLDIGAASGALATELAMSNISVTALEPNAGLFSQMLMRLQASPQASERVSPVPMCIEELDVAAVFDVVVAKDVLSEVPRHAAPSFIQAATNRMAPRGLLVVSVSQPSRYRSDQPMEEVASRVVGDVLLALSARSSTGERQVSVDYEATLHYRNREISKLGRQQKIALHTPEEVATLIEPYGLHVKALFGSWAGVPYARDAGSFVAVCCRED